MASSRCLSSFLNFIQLCEVSIISKNFGSLALMMYSNVVHRQFIEPATLGSFLYSNTDNDNGQYGETAGGSTKKQSTVVKVGNKKLRKNNKAKDIRTFFANTKSTAMFDVEKHKT